LTPFAEAAAWEVVAGAEALELEEADEVGVPVVEAASEEVRVTPTEAHICCPVARAAVKLAPVHDIIMQSVVFLTNSASLQRQLASVGPQLPVFAFIAQVR